MKSVGGPVLAELNQRFVYDPADPVPTVGGALWPFQSQGLQAGPADQREVERRADVLVYTSAPLERVYYPTTDDVAQRALTVVGAQEDPA